MKKIRMNKNILFFYLATPYSNISLHITSPHLRVISTGCVHYVKHRENASNMAVQDFNRRNNNVLREGESELGREGGEGRQDGGEGQRRE